jgi:ATP-dependent DNA helicase RecG
LEEVLFRLPLRYEDRTVLTPLGAALPGQRVVVEGEIQLAEVSFRRRRSLLVRLGDGSGFLNLRFFHFSGAQQQGLARGVRLRCFGEVRRGAMGPEIVHPEYRRVTGAAEPLPDRLTPVYPLAEGMTQGRYRQTVARALRRLDAGGLEDYLPRQVVASLGLPTLREALHFMHHPPVGTSLADFLAGRHPAQMRLSFEELLAHQLALQWVKRSIQGDPAVALADPAGLAESLRSSLPFSLTGAQARVLAEIDADLRRPRPMVRLVQGDVGCGKTVVAALAAARAVGSAGQVAVMAPTELLAEQHFRAFEAWFRPLGVSVGLLLGAQPLRQRRAGMAAVADGSLRVVVGTHALFQDGVAFAALRLVIIDEQHRFGVQQRLRLRDKGVGAGGAVPHQLIMTATPIPRTLAMTAHADLDVSVIDALPPGRTPVRTVVLPEEKRSAVVARVRAACSEGRQAYWVCPLVEESEELRAQAAEEMAVVLTEALPEVRVGLVHGRMPSRDKESVMARFKAGELQLLVATTVIEVGVDVPNASVMVIENAERMGLAQIHQLRGRVGRGSAESSCVLLYRSPVSAMARSRLATLRDTNDGFEIARRDLELRGPGELLGTRQTGLAELRVADLVRDAHLLPQVRDTASGLLDENAACIEPLRRRWIGAAEDYGRVG